MIFIDSDTHFEVVARIETQWDEAYYYVHLGEVVNVLTNFNNPYFHIRPKWYYREVFDKFGDWDWCVETTSPFKPTRAMAVYLKTADKNLASYAKLLYS